MTAALALKYVDSLPRIALLPDTTARRAAVAAELRAGDPTPARLLVLMGALGDDAFYGYPRVTPAGPLIGAQLETDSITGVGTLPGGRAYGVFLVVRRHRPFAPDFSALEVVEIDLELVIAGSPRRFARRVVFGDAAPAVFGAMSPAGQFRAEHRGTDQTGAPLVASLSVALPAPPGALACDPCDQGTGSKHWGVAVATISGLIGGGSGRDTIAFSPERGSYWRYDHRLSSGAADEGAARYPRGLAMRALRNLAPPPAADRQVVRARWVVTVDVAPVPNAGAGVVKGTEYMFTARGSMHGPAHAVGRRVDPDGGAHDLVADLYASDGVWKFDIDPAGGGAREHFVLQAAAGNARRATAAGLAFDQGPVAVSSADAGGATVGHGTVEVTWPGSRAAAAALPPIAGTPALKVRSALYLVAILFVCLVTVTAVVAQFRGRKNTEPASGASLTAVTT